MAADNDFHHKLYVATDEQGSAADASAGSIRAPQPAPRGASRNRREHADVELSSAPNTGYII
ncbi:MAG: hypothetical protein JWQ24_1497 [Tardiphaga sp.]|nr:hypothetical protein [Tardiphaga sp.]